MKEIKLYYKIRTTGFNPMKNSIVEVGGIIEVDGVEAESFEIQIRPHVKAKIEKGALLHNGLTEEEVLGYPPMEKALSKFKALLKKYVDPYDKTNKIWLVGFNNSSFDNAFVGTWFKLCDDNSYGNYFWGMALDTGVFSAERLLRRKKALLSYTFQNVLKAFKIVFDPETITEPVEAARLIRALYQITTLEDDIL